ncbi:GTP cyclohydrolase II [Rhizobium sp. LjRoot98]|uniref:GTP cyclohydrolase II n=1 Tax=Rhizobium sp. LjRoot98 TaxID=3342345 RepID=UPI003ECFBEC8
MRNHSPIANNIVPRQETNANAVERLFPPIDLCWDAASPLERGPILAGSQPGRNAIGVHAGPFAPYSAIAIASGALSASHTPDLGNTTPSVNIGPFPQWSDSGKIVALDPWGHRVAGDFAPEIASGRKVQPTIAVTDGRLMMPEIADALRAGRLVADGSIVDSLGGVRVTKIAIEPVWWLPGIADRLNITETALRRALVDASGGMYPDLVARPEFKAFLPPIGGTSVYLFGDPALLGKADTKIACRIHDECNGSDVFGSDMCTCRSYLGFAAEECVRTAQQNGLGVIAYNRKEGRALGEVVKYLVYNARRNARSGDRADDYFSRTEEVAGVRDVRYQELAVDVLHWLGVTRIDAWLSMSNDKRDAVVSAGIDIVKQVELPTRLIGPGAAVEISAKKAAGYFTETSA